MQPIDSGYADECPHYCTHTASKRRNWPVLHVKHPSEALNRTSLKKDGLRPVVHRHGTQGD